MEKVGSHFSAIIDLWEGASSNSSARTLMKNTSAAAQDAGTPSFSWGWCNEAVVYGFETAGMFQDDVRITPTGGHSTMRGRDFTSVRNNNVDESWNRLDYDSDEIPWEDIPVGSVVMLDYSASNQLQSFGSNGLEWVDPVVPTWQPAMGIQHTTTFLGLSDQEGYGWFLGGNQSKMLVPKEYQLSDATFISHFEDTGSYEDSTYVNWGKLDTLELTGNWKEEDFSPNINGGDWKGNTGNGPGGAWNHDPEINIQKFQKDGTDEEIFIIGDQDVVVSNGHLVSAEVAKIAELIDIDMSDKDSFMNMSFLEEHNIDSAMMIIDILGEDQCMVAGGLLNMDHEDLHIFNSIKDTINDNADMSKDDLTIQIALDLVEDGSPVSSDFFVRQFAEGIKEMVDHTGDQWGFSEMHRNADAYWDNRKEGYDYDSHITKYGILMDDSWKAYQQEYLAIDEAVFNATDNHAEFSLDWCMSIADSLDQMGYNAVDII